MKGFDALNDQYFSMDFERLIDSGQPVVATSGIGHSNRTGQACVRRLITFVLGRSSGFVLPPICDGSVPKLVERHSCHYTTAQGFGDRLSLCIREHLTNA
jgi:hypothetical protein